MIDGKSVQKYLEQYKQEFARVWREESFKWVAVKCFQDHWNIDAADFADMLRESLKESNMILRHRNWYPSGVIIDLAIQEPGTVRSLFRELFEGERDIYERIAAFKSGVIELNKRVSITGDQDYHDESTITTYLWLKFPDQYYIYKYRVCCDVAERLKAPISFTTGDYTENLKKHAELFTELNKRIAADEELISMFKAKLTDACYPDPDYHTLTNDFALYISRNDLSMETESIPDDGWWPPFEEYNPGFSKQDWLDILNTPDTIGPLWGGTLAGFYSFGGAATCKEVADKYGQSPSAIAGRCTQLAKRIQKNTKCKVLEAEGRKKYYSILFQGKAASENQAGGYIWKLRPELFDALTEFDIMSYEWDTVDPRDPETDSPRSWLFAPGDGAEIWEDCQRDGIMAIGWGWVGPVDGFRSVDEIKKHMNETGESEAPYKWPGLALWQIAHEMKPGDIVFAKTGRSQLLGRGVVEGVYYYDVSREEYRHCRKVRWTDIGNWSYSGNFIVKTLTDITPYHNMIRELEGLIRGETPVEEEENYWWVNADPAIWSFSAAPIGERRRIYQNSLDAKPGDMVIGYETSPVKQIVALAQITQEQDDGRLRLFFEKTEDLSTHIDYQTLINTPGLEETEVWKKQGSLYKLTKGEYECLMKLIREKNPVQPVKPIPEPYSVEDFLDDVYISRDDYNTLSGILIRKKNVLLDGAPGVGKTFAAKRAAFAMMGCKDEERVKLVQFHQSYSYEDFIMGFRPTESGGFKIHTGVFYDFCKKAEADPGREYFFIIDEINRGNLSKIFGELFMLIEADKRKESVQLLYKDEMFSVPANLYIIGMMNTADRSLAMIDYALRRRFSFFPMKPAFDAERFRAYQAGLNNKKFDKLIGTVVALNEAIGNDDSLGPGFRIGHSYFCELKNVTDGVLKEIVEYEIIPLLREYWFDEPKNVEKWTDALRAAIK